MNWNTSNKYLKISRVKVRLFPNIGIFSKVALFNMVGNSHNCLLKFTFYLIKIKYSFKFNFLTSLAIFQIFNSHVWLVVIISDNAELNISIISESSVKPCCLLIQRSKWHEGYLTPWQQGKLGFGIWFLHPEPYFIPEISVSSGNRYYTWIGQHEENLIIGSRWLDQKGSQMVREPVSVIH